MGSSSEGTTDMLANIIRYVDGNHDKGGAELAEAIIDGLAARGYAICRVILTDEEWQDLAQICRSYEFRLNGVVSPTAERRLALTRRIIKASEGD